MQHPHKIALDYVANELGHEDVSIVRSISTTSDEHLVLVSTEECGRFALEIIGNQVGDDAIPESEFCRQEESR